MTELEKKAKVYRESRKDLQYFSEPYKKKIEKAYVDGAKENGVVWHDLRKAPGDLPETLHPVYVKLDNETYVFAYCVNEIWHENDDGIILYHGNGKSEVIAWCEIPRFEEEVNK